MTHFYLLGLLKLLQNLSIQKLVSKITEEATAKRKLRYLISTVTETSRFMENSCLNIYESSIDTYTRYFQY